MSVNEALVSIGTEVLMEEPPSVDDEGSMIGVKVLSMRETCGEMLYLCQALFNDKVLFEATVNLPRQRTYAPLRRLTTVSLELTDDTVESAAIHLSYELKR